MSEKPKTAEEWEALVLSFIGSLTLCDHIGDVSNYVQTVLDRLGLEGEWDDWPDLQRWLHARGVKTLHGTSLGDE